jgi:probable phosphoglycerate mutase
MNATFLATPASNSGEGIVSPGKTRVFLIRHGSTVLSAEDRFAGATNVELSETGRSQARNLSHRLASQPISAFYASPLDRTMETAKILAEPHGKPILADPGFLEINHGEWEGLTREEAETRFADSYVKWEEDPYNFAPEGGESLETFSARCVEAATALAAAHPGQTVALVSHGGVLDCLYRAATRLTLEAPRTWLVTNASINRLLYTGEGFSLVGWADSSHTADLSFWKPLISSASLPKALG